MTKIQILTDVGFFWKTDIDLTTRVRFIRLMSAQCRFRIEKLTSGTALITGLMGQMSEMSEKKQGERRGLIFS